jgi:hypothetical protein
MTRRVKRTRKVKRTESFVSSYGMSPSELLEDVRSLPDRLRKKIIIREAQALV